MRCLNCDVCQNFRLIIEIRSWSALIAFNSWSYIKLHRYQQVFWSLIYTFLSTVFDLRYILNGIWIIDWRNGTEFQFCCLLKCRLLVIVGVRLRCINCTLESAKLLAFVESLDASLTRWSILLLKHYNCDREDTYWICSRIGFSVFSQISQVLNLKVIIDKEPDFITANDEWKRWFRQDVIIIWFFHAFLIQKFTQAKKFKKSQKIFGKFFQPPILIVNFSKWTNAGVRVHEYLHFAAPALYSCCFNGKAHVQTRWKPQMDQMFKTQGINYNRIRAKFLNSQVIQNIFL